jgi:hypothetical protein
MPQSIASRLVVAAEEVNVENILPGPSAHGPWLGTVPKVQRLTRRGELQGISCRGGKNVVGRWPKVREWVAFEYRLRRCHCCPREVVECRVCPRIFLKVKIPASAAKSAAEVGHPPRFPSRTQCFRFFRRIRSVAWQQIRCSRSWFARSPLRRSNTCSRRYPKRDFSRANSPQTPPPDRSIRTRGLPIPSALRIVVAVESARVRDGAYFFNTFEGRWRSRLAAACSGRGRGCRCDRAPFLCN